MSESKSEIAKAGKATKGEIPRDLLKAPAPFSILTNWIVAFFFDLVGIVFFEFQ